MSMFQSSVAKIALASFGAATFATVSLADVGHDADANIGQSGDVSTIDRVIEVDMGEMYFTPGSYDIKQGETIKFVMVNTGRAVHEFNIGTDAMQDAHLREMTTMLRGGMMSTRELYHDKMLEAGMMHADANARLLAPGESAELVWTFSGDAEDILIACNVPGHREAGMEAAINMMPATDS
ncbi:plastocyanin/azurin family copper-binding protein [Octadecabacter sp. SW4]|uniref:cupredoxin domain-containing protein n=1 Tax=Octadecabacter sp. SW4 TaxID=2602067 RepID=UPI0020C79179|nr:plastocyanin/azurin family copper-binding protein [Octadecabacter sp. SW4]